MVIQTQYTHHMHCVLAAHNSSEATIPPRRMVKCADNCPKLCRYRERKLDFLFSLTYNQIPPFHWCRATVAAAAAFRCCCYCTLNCWDIPEYNYITHIPKITKGTPATVRGKHGRDKYAWGHVPYICTQDTASKERKLVLPFYTLPRIKSNGQCTFNERLLYASPELCLASR
jgi:hypothetical protein